MPIAPLEVFSVGAGRKLPRPAPRQRPGPASGLVLLGDPPSFDEDDSDPHVCVMPCDAVAVPSLAATAACLSTWAGGLLFGADSAAGLGFQPHAGDTSPAPRPPRSPRQPRLRSRTSLVPSCPASRQKVSRSRRPAVFDAHAAGAYRPAHGASGRFAPVARKSAWRIRAQCRCISPATPECRNIPEVAPRRRQPSAMIAPPTPDSRRLSGFPV